ncbi:MAG: hypothetical protein A2031_02850 [Deltaproteobacteria bacterium RBG_19FT_COMBO_43_11]|nr:MAG: hypothetical protein A2031_02850 [Deltaproteobacteria bacterium RBG_19FT_COMBO_43_11]
MAKLNKRQIIILVIAALFVLYAAYEYLIAGPAAKKAKAVANPAQINTFVSDLQSDLIKDVVAGVDAYIIGRAEKDWQRNPFWERSSYKEWAAREGGVGSASAKIIYSGYVDSGKKKLAVINGFEYRIGEQLEMEGYILKGITPLKVILFNKNSGSEIEIPIQE